MRKIIKDICLKKLNEIESVIDKYLSNAPAHLFLPIIAGNKTKLKPHEINSVNDFIKLFCDGIQSGRVVYDLTEIKDERESDFEGMRRLFSFLYLLQAEAIFSNKSHRFLLTVALDKKIIRNDRKALLLLVSRVGNLKMQLENRKVIAFMKVKPTEKAVIEELLKITEYYGCLERERILANSNRSGGRRKLDAECLRVLYGIIEKVESKNKTRRYMTDIWNEMNDYLVRNGRQPIDGEKTQRKYYNDAKKLNRDEKENGINT